MDGFGLLVLLEAKTGKEKQVEDFLRSAEPLVQQGIGTDTWYAMQLGLSRYAIFDTFRDEEGRNAHLNGEVAKLLFSKAEELFASPPKVERFVILAEKAPRT
jgi:hypothetical protein